jgi:hypothetical protein
LDVLYSKKIPMDYPIPSGLKKADFEVHYNLQMFLELTEGSAME